MLQDKYKNMSSDQLLELIDQNQIENHDLTFVAEYLGEKAREIIKVLIKLLKHQDATVREGVLLGLDKIIDSQQDIIKEIMVISKLEQNLAVKKITFQILDEFFSLINDY